MYDMEKHAFERIRNAKVQVSHLAKMDSPETLFREQLFKGLL